MEISGEKMQNLVSSALGNLLWKHSLTTLPLSNQNEIWICWIIWQSHNINMFCYKKSQILWRAKTSHWAAGAAVLKNSLGMSWLVLLRAFLWVFLEGVPWVLWARNPVTSLILSTLSLQKYSLTLIHLLIYWSLSQMQWYAFLHGSCMFVLTKINL